MRGGVGPSVGDWKGGGASVGKGRGGGVSGGGEGGGGTSVGEGRGLVEEGRALVGEGGGVYLLHQATSSTLPGSYAQRQGVHAPDDSSSSQGC